MPDHAIAERLQRGLLAGHASLDELHHADPPAMAERAQSQTKSGGRFALARAGIDHQQALGDGFGGPFRIPPRLSFYHFGRVAFGLVGIDLAHEVLWGPAVSS